MALLATTPSRADEALRPRVAEALNRYYQERLGRPFIVTDATSKVKVSPPPWEVPIKQLSSPKPEDRRKAADYLCELVSLAGEHERSKTAPSRATPYWGGGAEVPARDLREAVADELAKAGPLPDALPVLQWYLENEEVDSFLEPVMAALAKLDGKDADPLRARLASQPHDNSVVVSEAINQLAAHKGLLPPDMLLSLCQHHRASIRKAACALYKQQSGKAAPPFDPEQAMRSPSVRKLLADIGAMIIDGSAVDAPWIVATFTTYNNKKQEKQKFDQVGWLVKQDGDKMEIFTPFGWRETVRKAAELTRDNKRENWWTCSIAAGNIETEVARVEKVRAADAPEFELSERGALTGQFQGRGAGLYELILAQRLHAAGHDALAARVLFPALETLYRDGHAITIIRNELGKNYGYQMLVAFAGDRDYERTEKLAKTLAKYYPDTIPIRSSITTRFGLPMSCQNGATTSSS
jgi:hypothetical protein